MNLSVHQKKFISLQNSSTESDRWILMKQYLVDSRELEVFFVILFFIFFDFMITVKHCSNLIRNFVSANLATFSLLIKMQEK